MTDKIRRLLERDYLTPLERFIKRSRVKPTEGQIEFALERLTLLRESLANTPTPIESSAAVDASNRPAADRDA